MKVTRVNGVGAIPAATWDALAGEDDPFAEHAFLSTLEDSGSVGGRSGWEPSCWVVCEVKETGPCTVSVRMERDGEAIGLVGALRAIVTFELTEAQWEVAEPMLKPHGLVRLRAAKACGSPSA